MWYENWTNVTCMQREVKVIEKKGLHLSNWKLLDTKLEIVFSDINSGGLLDIVSSPCLPSGS